MGFNLTVDADFTTQLLYTSIKTGVTVHIGDMGMNVLFDLLNFSAEIECGARTGGKKRLTSPTPMSVADMTKSGRVRL